MKTVRIGFAPVDFEEWAEADARPVFRAALDALRSLGAQVRETKMADLPYGPVTKTVIDAEGASVFEELIESGRVDELADEKQIAGLKAALDIPARDYLKAMRIRRLVQTEFRKVLSDLDILVAPARPGVASKISEPLDRSTPPGPGGSSKVPGLRALIPAGNLAGLPALVLPCGFVNGLPVAIQLVSRPFTENLLLAVGMQYQKSTSWHRERPKLS
jgi:aspartyl-tRNA(Asn)/glutamyl-tRNA(Gln) amidotransferase subunit A